jgi:hypothetical protein
LVSVDGTPVSATTNGYIPPLAAMTSVTLRENVFAQGDARRLSKDQPHRGKHAG